MSDVGTARRERGTGGRARREAGLARCEAGITRNAVAIDLAIVAIIAGVAVPNLLNAAHRGRQTRTMGDLRTIGTAVDSWSIKHDAYPRAATISELAALLEPTYVK